MFGFEDELQDKIDDMYIKNGKLKSTISILIFVMICQAIAIICMALTVG